MNSGRDGNRIVGVVLWRLAMALTLSLFPTLILGAGGDRIVLEHADSLRSVGGRRELLGSVKIRRDATRISANKAVQHPNMGIVILTGHVVLTEPGRRLLCDQMSYQDSSGDFEALGGVEMYQGDSIRINCGMAHYQKSAGRVDLYEKVIIDNLADGARITGHHAWWLEAVDEATVEGDPIYRLPDPKANPPDTLQIEGRKLVYQRRIGAAQFTGDVRLFEGTMHGHADSLMHQPDSSITILTGSPMLWRDNDELSGERIDVFYQERAVDSMLVVGKAQALSPARQGDERRNKMSGDRIAIATVDDSTRRIWVIGDAQGEYNVWDEKDVYQGVNLAAADEILLHVRAGRVSAIALWGRANGTFYPPDMEPKGKDTTR